MDQDKTFLSVIIPAYNEEKRIPETLRLIDRYLRSKGFRYEIVVVDDGSGDNTVGVVKDFLNCNKNIILLENGRNRGKGYSVKRGVLAAKGEYILFSDADLATPIEEFEKLFHWINSGHEVVIGSRKMRNSYIVTPVIWYRRLIGALANSAIMLAGLKHNIVDTQCGFKCFKKGAAKYIFSKQRLDGGMFDVEIICIAIKNRFNIKEVPVIWQHKEGSTINLFKCMLFDPIDLMKIKLNSLLKRY